MNSFDDIWNSVVIWTTSLTASWDTFEGHLKTSVKIDSSPSGQAYYYLHLFVLDSSNINEVIRAVLNSLLSYFF